MPGLPTDILTSIVNLPTEDQLERAYLQPVDLAPDEQIPWLVGISPGSGGSDRGAIAFQYWPESVSDSKGGGWTSKSVPGGSHPLRQWTAGGDRTIAFTAVLTTDTAPSSSADLTGNIYADQLLRPVNGLELGRNDVDVRVMISWLRWFMYPNYGNAAGAQPVYEPAKALLVFPNSGIGHTGNDYLVVTMDQCDVTYQEFFENGVPRCAEVSLSFTETVNEGRSVRFHSRRDFNLARIAGEMRLSVAGISR